MHKTPDGNWDTREIHNARPARKPEHRCDIPVRARIAWGDGSEQWIDTVAAGWSGSDVYVDATPLRREHGYRFNYVWLDAADVERR